MEENHLILCLKEEQYWKWPWLWDKEQIGCQSPMWLFLEDFQGEFISDPIFNALYILSLLRVNLIIKSKLSLLLCDKRQEKDLETFLLEKIIRLNGKYSRREYKLKYTCKKIYIFFSQWFLLTLLWNACKIWQLNLTWCYNLAQATTTFLLNYWNSLLNAFLASSLVSPQPSLH